VGWHFGLVHPCFSIVGVSFLACCFGLFEPSTVLPKNGVHVPHLWRWLSWPVDFGNVLSRLWQHISPHPTQGSWAQLLGKQSDQYPMGYRESSIIDPSIVKMGILSDGMWYDDVPLVSSSSMAKCNRGFHSTASCRWSLQSLLRSWETVSALHCASPGQELQELWVPSRLPTSALLKL